ncbi:TetR/AcrR family transcriptional regulator [Nocardioides perillae]|uniref:AcrR family transcriptional regulator n=1 Tax=Nocardioides perillae TaxID=1119534 RepID=A0A7Y9UKK9_9ACTN|nr:TetR/AcrR family transcriptional regulator [Nocardioides perillae]NYG54072.1 AcrR family transcriptional regulator [Nocardioides perillae]
MTSLRHNTQDAYLDAARACILDVGWRRTTLTEVARRAGVSRMTIYRTWRDMAALLADLMTREWGALVDRVGTRLADTDLDEVEQLAEAVSATVEALRANELFIRIVELDPELLLPYLLHRRGRSQDLVLALVEDQVRRGQEAGTVRTGAPAAIARGLVLAAHGFAFSSHTMVDDEVSEADVDAELRELVRRAVRA